MIACLNNIPVEFKLFEGQGPLLVHTTRGEVKAVHGDYIVTFHDGASCVIPSSSIDQIIKNAEKVKATDRALEETLLRAREASEKLNQLEGKLKDRSDANSHAISHIHQAPVVTSSPTKFQGEDLSMFDGK